MIPVIRSPMGEHYEFFRSEALQSPFVKSVTGVEEIIGAKHQVGNYRFEGMERSKPSTLPMTEVKSSIPSCTKARSKAVWSWAWGTRSVKNCPLRTAV